jgi:hypothetical protein
MSDELVGRPVPNLIQGISQQAAMQRRPTQAEEQFDCINSTLEGCIPRPGYELLRRIPLQDWQKAYFAEIERGTSEHYLSVVNDGSLRVLDLEDGSDCTVTVDTDAAPYLGYDGGNPRDNFCHATLNDTTFLASKVRLPAMKSDLSLSRPPEALIYFKAGGYCVTYQLAITYGGKVYRWTYTTPDNSTAGNAAYITTNHLAAAFYKAMTGGVAPTLGTADSGSTTTSDNAGVGAATTGGSGTIVGTTDIRTLGFSVEIKGNLLRIWRGSDQNDFSIDTADGQGDAHLRSFKDNCAAFSDLPKNGFDGFLLKVRGTDNTKDDDYYVQFKGKSASNGYWEECAAEGVKTTIDPATMPHVLTNTAFRAFTLTKPSWSTRIAGDEESCPDPSFIGTSVQDLFVDHNRLAILTEGTAVWSKKRFYYTFFRDTMQTGLADQPIDVEVGGGQRVALLRKAVQALETLYLWAPGVQYRVTSGQDPFKFDTVDTPPSTFYEFVEACRPCATGSSVYFPTEAGAYVSVRDLMFQSGKVAGDTDVTEHVSKLIPAGTRILTASDTLRHMVLQTDGHKGRLYLYNWLFSSSGSQDGAVQRAQSAWNIWRLPSDRSVLWCSFYKAKLYAALQHGADVEIVSWDMTPQLKDPGEAYSTRLDCRVAEAACSLTYDPATDRTTIQLPYSLGADAAALRIVQRTRSDNFERGEVHLWTQVGADTVTCQGDLTGESFYLGYRISAERLESRFYDRNDSGVVVHDNLTVANLLVNYGTSAYFRVEVANENGKIKTKEMVGRTAEGAGSETGGPVIAEGTLRVPVGLPADKVTLRLINDSHLPSAWQSLVYEIITASHSRPGA